MSAPRRSLKSLFCTLGLCLLGLWYTGSALVGLAKTAMFVHEAVVLEGRVGDVRQKPFEDWGETLGKGNLSWPGDVSYQPIVHFRMPSGLAVWYANLDADNENYQTGQQVSIIVPPDAPGKAKLYRWKFLWGADCLRLLAGSLLLLLPGWFMLKGKSKRRAAKPAAKQEQPRREQPRQQALRKPAPERKPAPSRKPAAPSQEEEPFALTAEPPAPRRKGSTPRKRKTDAATAEGGPKSPRKPRTRKKAEDGSSPAPKPRKPRRKAAAHE